MRFATFATALFLLASPLVSHAQKDTWHIDAEGNVNNTTYTPSTLGYGVSQAPLKLTNGRLYTRIGYVISEHFMLGIQGGYGISHTLYEDLLSQPPYPGIINYKTTTYQFGVFGRYTYWVTKRLYAYAHLSVEKFGVDNTQTDLTDYYNIPVSVLPDIPLEGNGVNISLMPGVGFEIIRGFGVHLNVGNIGYEIFNNPYTKIGQLNFNIGNSFTFGLQKVIGWKSMNSKPLREEVK